MMKNCQNPPYQFFFLQSQSQSARDGPNQLTVSLTPARPAPHPQLPCASSAPPPSARPPPLSSGDAHLPCIPPHFHPKSLFFTTGMHYEFMRHERRGRGQKGGAHLLRSFYLPLSVSCRRTPLSPHPSTPHESCLSITQFHKPCLEDPPRPERGEEGLIGN